MKVFIELEFEEMPSQAEVENYLHDLMYNNCLDWYVGKDAQLEGLLTVAHEAGMAVGHVTDYPNLSKHYAKYAMRTIKEDKEDETIHNR